MKFLLDMNLSPQTAIVLNKNGFDVFRINELIKEKGIEDEVIFNYAAENNLNIITSDYDFGEILAILKVNKPSTIIIKLQDRSLENVNRRLMEVLPLIKNELEKGSIIVIEDHRIRTRILPL